MDYVLDFARALTSGSPSRGRRRGGAGAWIQLRIALLGVMLGWSLPNLRGVDWHDWMPGGVRVELPHGGKVTWPAGELRLPDIDLAARSPPTTTPATERQLAIEGRFGRCGRGTTGDCVIDGDTLRWRGERIRIADIDAPETHPSRCAREARLGEAATRRLQALLNEGAATLAPADRATDRYGRRLAIVERDGASIGGMLVREGLARHWDGHRRPWC